MQISTIFTTLVLIAASLADTVVINSDKTTSGHKAITKDDVNINEGKTWNLIDTKEVKFKGDFENDGSLFVSSQNTDYDVKFKIEHINNRVVNDGTIVVSSGDSFWSPKFKISGGSFRNTGKIFVEGKGKIGTPRTEITSKSLHNEGVLSFYQDERNSGVVKVGKFWGGMNNDGTICLRNQAFAQQSRIDGTGCFDIGENSNVWIRTAALPIAETQTFFFSADSGSIRVEAISAPQTFHVRNFGTGNVLGLSWPISGYRYNADGILTVLCGLLDFHFEIGAGYDFTKFRRVTADFGQAVGSVINGGIVYDGDAPSSDRPEVCAACEEVPVYSP